MNRLMVWLLLVGPLLFVVVALAQEAKASIVKDQVGCLAWEGANAQTSFLYLGKNMAAL